MKKIITSIFIIVLFCTLKTSATVTLKLTSGSPKICNDNLYSGRIDVFGTIPLSFDLVLKADVYNNGLISWPTLAPCGDGVTTINPATISLDPNFIYSGSNNCPITVSTSPIYNPLDNSYKWTISLPLNCQSSYIIRFSYHIFLDCSLIPDTKPISNNQQLSLNVNGTAGSSTDNFTDFVPIPFITDAIVPNISQAVHVNGNSGQTSEMFFEYKNEGFDEITVDFTFADDYLNNCATPGYVSTGMYYDVSTTQPAIINLPMTSLGGGIYGKNSIPVPAQSSIYIRQSINVNGCTDNNTCVPHRMGIFNWKCSNSVNSCQVCQKTYTTPFVFDHDQPGFTVEYANNDALNQYDPACLGTESNWSIRVKNISPLSTISQITLKFNNTAFATSLSTVRTNQFPIVPSHNACTGCNTTFSAPIPAPGAPNPCNQTGTQADDFIITISNLRPQEYYEFPLKIAKCCVQEYTSYDPNPIIYNADWENMLLQNKPFNQWTVISEGVVCGNSFDESTSLNNLSQNINGGISSHSNTNNTDVDLKVGFAAVGADIDVPPHISGVTYRYGARTTQKMDFNSIFGDSFDKQVFGYDGTNQPAGSILRASIHCDKGLIIDDMGSDVTLTYTTAANPLVPITVSFTAFSLNLPKPTNDNGGGDALAPYPDCEAGDYDFYYVVPANNIDDFFSRASFQFTMTSCCTAADVSKYEVKFSVLPEAICQNFQGGVPAFNVDPLTLNNAHSFCWLPLAKKGFLFNVHCPGCRAPGIIVDYYEMFRNSFGFLDANNDRMADLNGSNLIPIDKNNLPPYALNRNIAVHGDEVIDRLLAHFVPGSPLCVAPAPCPDLNFRGYTYTTPPADMKNIDPPVNSVINLDVIQLDRIIPGGGCGKMAVNPYEADLYIDDVEVQTGPFPTILDNNDFPQSDRFWHRNTLYKIHLDNTVFNSINSPFYEVDNVTSPSDKEMMFTFHINDLHQIPIAPSSYQGASLVWSSTSLSNFVYLENQQYRLVVHYKVDGNTFSNSFTNPLDEDLHIQSEIKNWMWLTGGNVGYPNPHGFTIANHNNFDQMPNIIYDPTSVPPNNPLRDMRTPNPLFNPTGLVFDIPSTYCPSCALADQGNMGNNFKFFCEKRSNTFHFYSSDFYNSTGYTGNTLAPGTCEKTIYSYCIASFGRGNYGAGSQGHRDLFPFEFRPPSFLPSTFKYTNIPPGYQLKANSATATSYFFAGGVIGTPAVPILTPSLGMPTPPNKELNFSQNQIQPNFNCLTASTGNSGIMVSDEWFEEITNAYLVPDCQSSSSLSQNFVYTDAQITFGEVTSTQACPVTVTSSASTTCNLNQQIRQNDAGSGVFTQPNPNLNLYFNSNAIMASNNQVCWEFTMENHTISSVPPITPAYNVYIQVPNISSLSNWTIEYDYSNNVDYQPAVQTDVNNNEYFALFPTPPTNGNTIFPYFDKGMITVNNGKVCAQYSPCLSTPPPAQLTFNWGWNCTDDIATPNTCGNEFTDVTLDNNYPLVIADNSTQNNTASGGVILCDDYSFGVNFVNTNSGDAIPHYISFISNAPFNISPGSVVIKRCDQPSNISYPQLQPDGTYLIDLADLQAQGILNDLTMGQGDCFRLEASFTPQCQFEGTFQMPEIQLAYYTFCDEQINPPTLFASAPFDPVDIIGTDCNNCFSITKTATPNLVISGTDEVTYTVSVCSFNVNAQSANIWDDFPAGFNPTTPSPLWGTSLSTPLLISSAGNATQPVCTNTYIIKGTFDIPGDATCNTAYLDYDFNQSIDVSSQACIDVEPACRDMYNYPGVYIISAPNNIYGNLIYDINFLNASEYVVEGQFIINVPNAYFSTQQFHMEAGSEIVVQPRASLWLYGTQLSSCCCKMWKGITLLNNAPEGISGSMLYTANYKYDQTNISDAENAVTVNDICIASINNTGFYNNYIGINMLPPHPLLTNKLISTSTLAVNGTLFTGTGSLMMPYMGQTTTLGHLPKTGIQAFKCVLNLQNANGGKGNNEFINMSNGILLYNTSLQINKASFTDIIPDDVYIPVTNLSIGSGNSFNYNGSGIAGMVTNKGYVCYLRQRGFGIMAADPFTFNNCNYGIFNSSMQLSSDNNRITNVNTAYHVRVPRISTVISTNNINSNQNAIELMQYDVAPVLEVWNNFITFGNSNSVTYPNWAILAEGNLIPSDLREINNNTINFKQGANSSFGGIRANAGANLKVINNQVFMVNNDVNNNGILITGNRFANVSCNRVTGSGYYNVYKLKFQSAITNEMGNDLLLGCNILDKTVNGLYIQGPITNNTTIRSNTFKDHVRGLYYSASAITTPQDKQGNLWKIGGTQSGGLEAENDGSTTNISQSEYHYNLANPTPPTGFHYNAASTINWFKTSSGANSFCDDGIQNTPDYCTYYPAGCNNCLTDIDQDIAAGNLVNDPYTDETRWMMEQELYAKLDKNASLRSSMLMNNFYNSNQGTTLSELVSVSDDNSTLFDTDSLFDSTLVYHDSLATEQLNLIQEQVYLLDTVISNNDTVALHNITSAIDGYSATLGTSIATVSTASYAVETNRATAAATINAANNTIIPMLSPAENERLVNNIYLNTIAINLFEFTDIQAQTLWQISQQCPMSGGNAVFRARSLYALIDKTVFYDDAKICNDVGIEARIAGNDISDKSNAWIYPNPTANNATLEYRIDDNAVGQFIIYSMPGQQLYRASLTGGNGKHIFNTANLYPGVYQYMITSNGSRVHVGKLVIVR